MFSVALSRGRIGHIRRILIVGLATLLLMATLTLVPGAPLGPQRAEAANPPAGGNAGSCVADVVFILDRSGSMGWDNNAGRDALRAGFAAFIDGLSDGSRIGSVDFAELATPAFGGAWKTLPGDKTTLVNYVNQLTPDGLTNWEDALLDAATVFGNRPANPFPAYAIFITDGDPTTSNTTGGTTNNDFRDHALNEAAALKAAIGATGGTVIGIGAGSNFARTTSQERLESVVDQMIPVANMGDLPGVIEAQLDTVCAPVISIEKTAAPTSLPEPGGTVDYSVSVTNESALSQADVYLTDFSDDLYPDFPGNAACVLDGTPVLDPFDVWIPYGQTLNCSWTESSTFQGVNPGFSVTNTATTRGADPNGRPTAPKTDDATVVVTDVPSSIEVTKAARQPDSLPEPGGFFSFDVTVRNTSAVDTVTISTLDDNIHGDLNGDRPGLQSSCAVPRDLGPGEAYQCAFTVEINGDPGDYPNTVTATGTDDDGNPVTDEDNATVTIGDVPSEINVTKTANPTTVPEPGGDVTFTARVDNDSAVDEVTIATLIDNIHGDLNGQGSCVLPQTIAAGGAYTCSFTAYVSGNGGDTEVDTVTATGTDDDGNPVTDEDNATVTILESKITLVKTGALGLGNDGVANPGDIITYEFAVANASGFGVVGIHVDDLDLGGINVSCPKTVLAIGESMSCTASYPITQGDINSGEVLNCATAIGLDPLQREISAEDCFDTTIPRVPAITIEKATNGADADTATGPLVAVGGDVTWAYVVTNTGNVDLGGITVVDDQSGVSPVYVGGDIGNDGVLGLTETWVYEATGTAVAGQYANLGTASGTDPLGRTIADEDPSHYYGVTAGVEIQKTTNGEDADTATGPLVAVGDEVKWVYLVWATGNSPIRNVVVTDDHGVVVVFSEASDSNDNGLLDPGEIWVYKATGTAVAGQYKNIGTVTGTDSLDRTVGDSDPSHYHGVNSAITIEKTGALGLGDDGIANPGDVITYEFEVTNDGNVDLIDIDVEDLDLGGITVSCPATALADGESMTCSAEYPIAQEDINAGVVQNCALAAGLDPLEDGVSDEDCFDTTVPQTPMIDVEKATNGVDADTVDKAAAVFEGDPVTWTYIVTNTGNVPLAEIALVDDMLGIIDCPADVLAVGASMTCEANGIAELVAYANIGTVFGFFEDTMVTSEDPSHYAGIAVAGTAQLGDTVWNDTNKNGVQDSGEVGINGAKVVLKDADGTVIATATTAKGPWDGWYKFVGLDAGRYTVTLDMSSVSGSLTTASSFTIDLADGVEYLDADFGLAEALPTTGANTEGMLIAALLMLGVGGVLVLATRRRREES